MPYISIANDNLVNTKIPYRDIGILELLQIS